MILTGTFHDGAIVLDEPSPFAEGEKVQFHIVNAQQSQPKRHTAEELKEIFGRVHISTNGWKFNRDEANER